jgi:ABC-type multidrug transport system fused ATPase/permease subunit
MVRTLAGYAIVAVIGILAIKLVFGLLGLAFSLLWSVVWLAAIGFVIYLILKIVSPSTARRVRDAIRGEQESHS